MKKLLIFYMTIATLAGTLLPFVSGAQKKFNKEQKALLKEADYYLSITDYFGALKIYKLLYPVDSLWGELNHKIGICYFNTGSDKKMASGYFSIAAKNNYNEGRFYLALCNHIENRFDEEIALLEQYKAIPDKTKVQMDKADRQLAIARRAIKMVKNPVYVKIENLGPVINTRFHEYVPLINADESILIFTSRRDDSTGELRDPYGQYFEDIYVSFWNGDSWSQPEGISMNINTPSHDACVGLSSDGTILIVYYVDDNLKTGDLFLSNLEGDVWSVPQKMEGETNSPFNESSACLNTDGNLMYFSSDRPGGFGGKDLYRVVRFMNGEWSLPWNMGPVVNTALDEDAPFIHPDGVTLYFSSKGHETMGGYDIFKSVYEDSVWTKPLNMGYPVNTADDDIYFVLSTDGKRGYFSSERKGGQGKQDIYMMQMPPLESKPLLIVKGMVESADSVAAPLRAKLTVTDELTGVLAGIYNSNKKTGKFMMVLKPDTRYFLLVKSDGYESQEQELYFKGEEVNEDATIEIQLKPK